MMSHFNSVKRETLGINTVKLNDGENRIKIHPWFKKKQRGYTTIFLFVLFVVLPNLNS